MSFIVAIDGPSGTGKGTVTSVLAKKFDLLYLDTGAMYRCVTLKLINNNIKIDEIDKIKNSLKNINIEFRIDKNNKEETNRVFLDGIDVTKEIREAKVNNMVSPVSHIPEVRYCMVELQRKMSHGKDVILEGRDIGTNVFPNADVKIYLDASVDERVKRRVKQNKEKGIDISEDEVRKNIIFRDETDKNAKIAPLKQAKDAIYVDTSDLSVRQVINKLSKIIKKAKKTYIMIENAYVMTKETPLKKFRRAFVKNFLATLYYIFYRVEKNGVQNIQTDEGLIICANHLNYLDAAGIILLNKTPIRFVAKSDLYRVGLLSRLGHLFNIIPVKRDSSDISSIKLCLKSLKNNEKLGIFPEGTRHGLDKHAEVKNGACYLAYKANVKIVPVGIRGTFKPFTKVTFNYGEPIDISKYKTDDPNWIDDATKVVMDKIVELSNNYVDNNSK